MAGSLLDNDDFSSIGSSKAQKSGSSADIGSIIKIAVIVLCLGGAGLLFAYQAGLIFQPKPKADTRTDQEIQQDEEMDLKDEQFRERLRTLPGYQEGDA